MTAATNDHLVLQQQQQQEEDDDNSPSLSISDLYDANSQPITIQSSTTIHETQLPPTKRSNSVVANALAVPGALKDFLYPSTSSSKSTVRSNASIKEEEGDSSSSGDDEERLGWLQGKRRSGMKLVYGLLGGNTVAGSPSTALDIGDEDEDDDEEDEEDNFQPRSSHAADEAEILDDRTMTNFKKYFVLPEAEKLLTGKSNVS